MDAIISRLRSEPALVVAILVALLQGFADSNAISWETALTVLAGVATRFLVSPAYPAEPAEEG